VHTSIYLSVTQSPVKASYSDVIHQSPAPTYYFRDVQAFQENLIKPKLTKEKFCKNEIFSPIN